MIRNDRNGLVYFRFSNLSAFPELRHGVFSRQGGVSPGPYAGLNVGMGVKDDPENVRVNRSMIQDALGANHSLYLSQVHGTAIYCPKSLEEMVGDSPVTADAMVTQVPGVAAAICVADCQPVLLYDPERKVIGNIHSGWRGSVANIVGDTVRCMVSEFGCNPCDIHAGIGPSLGPCCAEFANYKKEIPDKFWPYRDGNNYFDFWAITRDQLKAAGVPEIQIETSGICTRCSAELFFSYRKDNATGRFAAVMTLMES